MIEWITMTLDNPLTDEQWNMIADVDFDNTEEVTFHTKNGKDVVFVKRDASDVRPVRPCDGCPFCVCEKHGIICPSDPDFRCDTRGGADDDDR